MLGLLKRAEAARSQTVKEAYLFLVEMCLRYYSAQYQIFQLSKSSMVQIRAWNALRNLIRHFSDQLKMKTLPMPLLGDDYFATGSFTYFRDLSIQLRKDFYFIAVDSLDPPIFWPLIAHEIAHCWLNETKYLDRIFASPEVLEVKRRVSIPVEQRLEEALCDMVATRLLGPAYVWAYTTRLWPVFPQGVHENYPSHPFRLECMCEMLDRMELDDVSSDLRKLRDQRFRISWQDEEISPLKDIILEMCEDFPCTISKSAYIQGLSATQYFFDSPPKDPVILFLSCWNKVHEKGLMKIHEFLPKFRSAILETLGI